MTRCPRCGDAVEERRRIPPGVMTRELADELDGEELLYWVCRDCYADLTAADR